MNIVLIHIGNKLPDYFWTCVDQIRRYFDGDIYTVISSKIDCKEKSEFYKTYTVPIEDFLTSRRVKAFDKADVVKQQGEFWSLAFKRMFILEEVIRKFELGPTVHIENDVLIYENPFNLNFGVHQDDGFVYATPVGPKYTTYAYCYIPNISSIKILNNVNLRVLSEGYDTLLKRYGEDNVNEMLIARELYEFGVLEHFPVLPIGEASEGMEMFNRIFDGASWGQFCFGTPTTVGIPFKGDHHFVGAELLKSNPLLSVEWRNVEYKKNPKVVDGKVVHVDSVTYREPFVVDSSGLSYKLVNMHMHCKKLELGR